MFNCTQQNHKEHCAEIWNWIKSSLFCNIQDVALNIELLQKCREDAQLNAALQKEACNSVLTQVTLGDYSDDDDDDENSDDVTEIFQTIDDHFVDLDMLYQAFSIVKDKW